MSSEPCYPELPAPYDEALRGVIPWIIAICAPTAIIACGSIIRGEGDLGSDLDLQVVHDQPWRQRLQRFSHGVPCEILVNPLRRLLQYFSEEQAEGRPSTAHMLATGFVVLDPQGLTPGLLTQARHWLALPPATTPEQLTRLRYAAADQVENAQDLIERDPEGAAYLAGLALEPILGYWHLSQGRQIPRGKDALTSLSGIDPVLGGRLRDALRGSCRERVDATRELAQHCLGVTGFFPWESPRDPC
jgi:hypothetical protein